MKQDYWTNRKLALLLVGALVFCVTMLWATSTVYTQPFAAGHGWTYTSVSCGGTCTQDMAFATDGNPAPSILAKIVGKAKTSVGYAKHTYTWENLGVPVGDSVTTVDGAWDTKQTHTTGNCSTSATAGMQLFDSANTTEITASAIEPTKDVSGQTVWTTNNPTGAVAVTGTFAPSGTTITLRFNMNPATTSVTSADCEIIGDNYKLTIVSSKAAFQQRHRVVIASWGMNE